MLLLTDDILMARDVHAAAAQLIELTQPTLVQAKRVESAQNDDF